MARLLYRLGLGSARHPFRVLVTWLLVILVSGGAMATLAKPLSNEFSLPGSEFEQVLDDLGQEVPAVSGGQGQLVFRTEDGAKFTPEQRAAISRTVAELDDLDMVRGTVDPFATQQRIDDGGKKLREGRAELNRGERRIAKARYQLRQLDAVIGWERENIATARAQGSPNLATYQQGLQELLKTQREGKAKFAQGVRQLEQGRTRLENGTKQYEMSKEVRFVSPEQNTALAQVMFVKPLQNTDPEDRAKVPEIGDKLNAQGVEVDYAADIVRTNKVGGIGEVIGLVIAAIVLVVMLGALVLAGMPLAVAFVGVGVATLVTMSLTHFFTLHQMAPVLGSMLGLAVGIDYALFIVNRHRDQLRDLGPKPTKAEIQNSIGMATGTAGNAVVVAGATVVIALTALTVSGIPILVQMGLLAAFAVATTVAVALTVTPALLGLAGARAVPRAVRKGTAKPQQNKRDWTARWVSGVTKRPMLAVLAIVLVLGIVALPALSLRLGLPDGNAEEGGSTGYEAYKTISEEFGPGSNGPIVVRARFDEPIPAKELAATQNEVGEPMAQVAGVEAVVPIGTSKDRQTIAYQILPRGGPSSEETLDVVHSLEELRGTLSEETGAEIGFTGQTVANVEVSDQLAGALPLYLTLVVGLSLLLLTMVFRSVVVPLLATAGFLLSVAASFGAVVAVYQWGWLGDYFGVTHPGPILSFMPTLLIGILFGLAMDYQMFLVSGMRESYAHGEKAKQAVSSGFRAGARVVAAAAIIMISVFGGFMFSHMTMIRPIGFALAFGVLVDAFVIRMTLTPAVMSMLGDKAWWIPAWLDRILPDLDVEGSSLVEMRRSAEADRAGHSEDLEDARV